MTLVKQPNAEPIPGYRLIERLGSGGFGEVWKCEAPGGLFKAIKFVYGNLDALDVDAFKAEQELNALEKVKAIRHPFILSMERVETISGELMIVMELADKSLHDRLLECQQAGLPGIPRDELLHYLRDAAEALDLMNRDYDLQHLDIKPRNLFLMHNHVKVADFGLVKGLEGMTSSPTNGLLGGVTPLYASPETFQGIISRHSDQYSLAIVYQELLTNTRPFTGKNPRQLAIQHMREQPDVSALPPADQAIVVKALSKDPRHRFASCMALFRALHTGQLPSTKTPAPSEAVPMGVPAPLRPPVSMPETMEDIFIPPIDPAHVFKLEGEVSPAPEEVEVSITVAQPNTGSLKPTLVIGLGNFGRQALQALRCRFIDRFSSLSKIPLLRFMCLDTDQEALQQAQRGATEQALGGGETYHLPLQPIQHFRRNRQVLEAITEWLPLEKLYTMPRSLATQGGRALGRLAFADNYLRLAARLKRELQLIIEPEKIFQSVNQTGLALRSNVPQVYILAAAGGGAGSGILIDLGYTLRRLLHDMKQPHAEVVALLMCGAPSDPAMPAEEQANLYATLTEINHFSDPAVSFSAQYGVEGPQLKDKAPPFHATYLVKMPHRSPEGLQQAASRLATYVFHDLSTPLGIRLQQSRQAQYVGEGSPFRSFGTYAVWFPRGLVLRVAARRACQRLLHNWQVTCQGTDFGEVFREADKVFTEPRWRAAHIQDQIQQATTTAEGPPSQALTSFLDGIETQADHAAARDDPAGWCRQVLERVREWVGSGISAIEGTSEWRRSRVHRLFVAAVQKVADEYIDYLAVPARALFDQPDYRLGAADALLGHFVERCEERISSQETALHERVKQTEECWQQVDLAVQACLAGTYSGFSFFFGNRTRRLLRAFLDRLSAYARERLAEESARSVQHFYAALKGKLEELRRDFSFCQQRLRHLEERIINPDEADQALSSSSVELDAGAPRSFGATSTRLLGEAAMALASRIVLPEGAEDLELAAAHFLDRLTEPQWADLDRFLQGNVLTPFGGLHQICITSSDLTRTLGASLLESAADYLGQQLPVTDVSEAELSAAKALDLDLVAQAKAYHSLAVPSLRSEQPEWEQGFLLVPASEAGRRFGELTKSAFADLNVVRTSSHTDLLFCREQAQLVLRDLQHVLEPCKPAYIDACTTTQTTPHSRCDILDWIPLDP